MSTDELLNEAGGVCNVYSLAARFAGRLSVSTPASEADRPQLRDLTVTSEVKQHWEYGYNAWVRVPIKVPEEVSLVGVRKAVNRALAGRLPMTHRTPNHDTFVALFRVADGSAETLQAVREFALSMAEVLGPLATGGATVQVTHLSKPLAEPLEVRQPV